MEKENIPPSPESKTNEELIKVFNEMNASASREIEKAAERKKTKSPPRVQAFKKHRKDNTNPATSSTTKSCTAPPPPKLYSPKPCTSSSIFRKWAPKTTMKIDSPPTPTPESRYRESASIKMAKQRLKERESIIQKEGRPTYRKNKICLPPISPVAPRYRGIVPCGTKKVYMYPDTRERYLDEIRLKESKEFVAEKLPEIPASGSHFPPLQLPFTPPPMDESFGRNQHLNHLPSGLTRYGTVQPNAELILLDNICPGGEVPAIVLKKSDPIQAAVPLPTPSPTEVDLLPIPKVAIHCVKGRWVNKNEESMKENKEKKSRKKKVPKKLSPALQNNNEILNVKVNEKLTPSPESKKRSRQQVKDQRRMARQEVKDQRIIARQEFKDHRKIVALAQIKDMEEQVAAHAKVLKRLQKLAAKEERKSSRKSATRTKPRAKKRKRSSEQKNEMVEEIKSKPRPATPESENYSDFFNISSDTDDEDSVKIAAPVAAELPAIPVPELEAAKVKTVSIWPPRDPNLSEQSTDEDSDVSDLELADESPQIQEAQATIVEKSEGLPSNPEFSAAEVLPIMSQELLVPELSFIISKKIETPDDDDNSQFFPDYITTSDSDGDYESDSSLSSSYSDASTLSSPRTPCYSPIDFDVSNEAPEFNDATLETSPGNVEVDTPAEIPPPLGTNIDIDGSKLTAISESRISKNDNSYCLSILEIPENSHCEVTDPHSIPVVVHSPSGISAVVTVDSPHGVSTVVTVDSPRRISADDKAKVDSPLSVPVVITSDGSLDVASVVVIDGPRDIPAVVTTMVVSPCRVPTVTATKVKSPNCPRRSSRLAKLLSKSGSKKFYDI